MILRTPIYQYTGKDSIWKEGGQEMLIQHLEKQLW